MTGTFMTARAGRGNQEVGKAIAIDIPGETHERAGIVSARRAAHAEAIGAVEGSEFEIRTVSAGLAENHEGRAVGRALIGGLDHADEEVGFPIPVHVVATAHENGIGARASKAEFGPVGAVQFGETEIRREGAGVTEDDVAGAGMASRARVVGAV